MPLPQWDHLQLSNADRLAADLRDVQHLRHGPQPQQAAAEQALPASTAAKQEPEPFDPGRLPPKSRAWSD